MKNIIKKNTNEKLTIEELSELDNALSMLMENGLGIEVYRMPNGIFDESNNLGVDARELWTALGMNKNESMRKWLMPNLQRGGFEIEIDYFEVLGMSPQNPQGGRPRTDYMLSLDAAKEIGMMSGGKMAGRVRKYFLNIEKKFYSLVIKVRNESTLPVDVDFSDPISAQVAIIKAMADQINLVHQEAVMANKVAEENAKEIAVLKDDAERQTVKEFLKERRLYKKYKEKNRLTAFGTKAWAKTKERGLLHKHQATYYQHDGKIHTNSVGRYPVFILEEILEEMENKSSKQYSVDEVVKLYNNGVIDSEQFFKLMKEIDN